VSEPTPSILIVEDDLDVADMLNAYFKVQGYDIHVANWGEDGVRVCHEVVPQLVILDIRLPDIDGYEVARRLRKNRRTQNIPIIFLTEKRTRSDRLQGLELGADDYITKPFDVQELRLRVRNALSRSAQGALTNPVTNLPEGILVNERLEECLTTKNWVIFLIGLRNLDRFRDVYGFVASDDVLRAVALMINNAVRDVGKPDDFVGHFNPTEFLVVTGLENPDVLLERVVTRLEQSLDYFYPLKDRGKSDDSGKRLAVSFQRIEAGKEGFKDLASLKAKLEL
jgi:DNA-binding response OmpR family regulator